MVPSQFASWLATSPIWAIGAVLLLVMAGASLCGFFIRRSHDAYLSRMGFPSVEAEGQNSYIVPAVLGLLALLLGFTFSLAIDRFETRRALVLDEANAIGTTYLRTQLLDPPYRQRISCLLVTYTDNRLVLASAARDQIKPLIARNDQLIADLWNSTVSAFPSVKSFDFSIAYLESMNALIDLDASRKAARLVRIPPQVFLVLFVYLVATALVLGYVLRGFRGWLSGLVLYLLTTLSLVLIIDIDRPASGRIRESQEPLETLRASLAVQQNAVPQGIELHRADCAFLEPQQTGQ